MTRVDQERRRGSKTTANETPSAFLHNHSVRTRVAMLVLLPLIATLVLGVVVVKRSLDEAQDAIPAEHLTRVGVAASEVANRVKNERSAWSFAETVPGNAHKKRLEAADQAVSDARSQTDASVDEYFAELEALDASVFGRDVESAVDTFQWAIDELDAQRAGQDEEKEGFNLWQYYNDLATEATDLSTSASDIIVRQREMGSSLQDAIQGTQDAASRARLVAIISAAGVVAVLAITALLTVVVARSIIGPLRRLRGAALDTAKTNLPALVNRIQQDGPGVTRNVGAAAKVEGADEIGQVASAFNDVHATAVRIAGEQALLRQNLDTIVVNLSRRTQSLIDRQLGELEGLESQERNPDQLSTLFRIDHMATRVRRHADSLLILAGVDDMRRQTPASPVLDVVRGAVGEVEQYTRVEFGVMPADLVVASAVHDVAHLLAELIDNATEFSAPSTPVTVTSQPLLGGGLRIQVTDTGLGIPPDQLADLNNRLTGPGDIDVAASRTLGLYVVARLAAKHGIQVRLEPGHNTGTIAQVDLPSSVILSPLDTTDDVMSAASAAESASVRNATGPVRPATPPAQPTPRRTPAEPATTAPVQPASRATPPAASGQGVGGNTDQAPLARRPVPPAQTPPPKGPVQPLVPSADARPTPEIEPKATPGTSLWDAEVPKAPTAGRAEKTGGGPPQPPSIRASALNEPQHKAVAPLTAREHTPRNGSLNVPPPALPKSDTPVYDAVRSAWFSRGQMPESWRSPADEGWRRAAEARKAAEAATAATDIRPSLPQPQHAAMPLPTRPAPGQGTPAPDKRGERGLKPPARPAPEPAETTSPAMPAVRATPAPTPPPERKPATFSPSLWATSKEPAQPAAQAEPAPATSAAGLPVRRKGASLLPGSIDTEPKPDQEEQTSQPTVDVKHVASSLSSLQRGVSRGREETGGWVPKRPGGQERSSS